MEDQQLIDICNKIYNKHKKALDLIFEYRIDGTLQIANTIKNTLQALSDEGIIIYDTSWGCVFRTEEMDNVLPLLDELKSSYSSYNIYSFWFAIREGRFAIIFELGGRNVPQKDMATMQRMIDKLMPNDKRRENFKYKRLYRTKWYDVNEADDIETEVAKQVKDAVNDILNMQDDLLDAIKE